MSVRVVVRRSVVEASYRGGVVQYAEDAHRALADDGEQIAVHFDDPSDGSRWIEHLALHGVLGDAVLLEAVPFQRFDLLSKSASGLSYVRERRLGVTRVLTPSELEDFSDPRPCAECGEQFGCEHFNCAGEPLFSEAELDEVPPEWRSFAGEYGVSRADLERLRQVERHDGEYRIAEGSATDMRTLELVLLLNEAR
jgi:hypothetical protein